MVDSVYAYLPIPTKSKATMHDTSLPVFAPSFELTSVANASLVALAFKLEAGRFVQLTDMRVYQGTMGSGYFIFYARIDKKVPRLIRMYDGDMEVGCELYLSSVL